MSVAADDDVVVHRVAARAGDLDDLPGHLDVGPRRRGVARGVIVHEDDRDVLARLPPSAVLLTTVVHICGEVTAVSSARADRADSPIRPPFLQMRHLFRVVGAARPPEWPQ
jgi:hypothetical protein